MKALLMTTVAAAALACGSAHAWMASDNGGRERSFIVTSPELNLRQESTPASAILTTIPNGARVWADHCIHPVTEPRPGVDWCHVRYGDFVGWVNASYLFEPGRGYAGPMPVQAPPPNDAPIARHGWAVETRDDLPRCDDADVIMKAVRLSGGISGAGFAPYLIVGDAHALRVNNIDGSKVCRANFRADIDAARAAEDWIRTGPRPLTQLAAGINRAYDDGAPVHVTFAVKPNGEGGYAFSVIDE